jgi:hypothetical protein
MNESFEKRLLLRSESFSTFVPLTGSGHDGDNRQGPSYLPTFVTRGCLVGLSKLSIFQEKFKHLAL